MNILRHRDMILDAVRAKAYQEAIHAQIKPGDRVCDLGCGSGILGFFALQAGAGHVYGIEPDAVVETAQELARVNGYGDQTTYFRGISHDVDIPEPVDWIVLEWMGPLGAYEVPFSEVADAINRFLKPSGGIIPAGVEHFVAPISDPAAWEKAVGCWRNDWYGIDFSSVRRYAAMAETPLKMEKVKLLAEPVCWLRMDYFNQSAQDVDDKFESGSLRIKVEYEAECHGLAAWFKADLGNGIILDNAPGSPATHWDNVYLPFEQPLAIQPDDELQIELGMRSMENTADAFWTVHQYRKDTLVARAGSSGLVAGMIDSQSIARITGAFIPLKGAADQKLATLLELIDGKRTASEISLLANEKRPDLFPDYETAMTALIGAWRKRPLKATM